LRGPHSKRRKGRYEELVLLPIRIDDAVFEAEEYPWIGDCPKDPNIGDFSRCGGNGKLNLWRSPVGP